ncbi:hypothetical protein ACKX2D_05650 [Lachnospiraceae bacterium YH-ros2226]
MSIIADDGTVDDPSDGMYIRIDETYAPIGFNGSMIVKDIERFQDLPSWLLALKKGEIAFHSPDSLNCAIIMGRQWLWVIRAGQVTKDIGKTIKKVKRLPAYAQELLIVSVTF